MNSIVVISCLMAVSASATLLTAVPHVTTTQYHSQGESGQYSYGYSGGPSAKEETRTADGITRGSYSYIDANGIVQSASYVSDPIHGFRVVATNLPQASSSVIAGAHVAYAASVAPTIIPARPGFDYVHGVPLETAEVAAAKAAHFAAHSEALARLTRRWKRSLANPVATGKSYSVLTPSGSTTVVAGSSPSGKSFSYSTIAASPIVSTAPAFIAHTAPVSTAIVSRPTGRSFSYSTTGAIPIVTSTPAMTTYSAPIITSAVPLNFRYQAQDELGQYSYGYSDGLSSKTESRTADGVTHGQYSYLDSNGIVQSVKYIVDSAGFRVHATNLPVGPGA